MPPEAALSCQRRERRARPKTPRPPRALSEAAPSPPETLQGQAQGPMVVPARLISFSPPPLTPHPGVPEPTIDTHIPVWGLLVESEPGTSQDRYSPDWNQSRL